MRGAAGPWLWQAGSGGLFLTQAAGGQGRSCPRPSSSSALGLSSHLSVSSPNLPRLRATCSLHLRTLCPRPHHLPASTFTLHLSPFTSWSPALDPFAFDSQFVLSSLLRKQKPLKRPRGRIWPPAPGLAGVSVAVDGHCPASAILGEDAASGPVSREGLGTWLGTCT